MNENVSVAPGAERQKLPLSHSPALKALAFVMAIVFLALLALGILGAAAMLEFDVYSGTREELRRNLYWSSAVRDGEAIANFVAWDNYDSARRRMAPNIAGAEISCTGSQKWSWSSGRVDMESPNSFEFEMPYFTDRYGNVFYGWEEYAPDRERGSENVLTVRIMIAEKPTPAADVYWLGWAAAELAFSMRYGIYLVVIVSFGMELLCLAFLMRSAGRRRGKPGITPARTTAIPFDLLTAAVILLAVLGVCVMDAVVEGYLYSGLNLVFVLLVLFLVAVAAVAMVLAWTMSLALRIKLHSLLRDTICFRLLRLCWRCLRAVWRTLGRCAGGLRRLCGRLALFWKAALVFGAIALLEFFGIIVTDRSPGLELMLWFVEKLVLLAGLMLLCNQLRELYNCGRAVAAGNMDYKVDTRYMPSQFREHAEDMRSLSMTVNRAVEQRLSSERMKTELITNVSHDLKTPLTSLINYSDLICREECDNPHHAEYARVLHRQSERMKHLIEDLVEASKASTGNLEVELRPCEAGVMLMQVAGEYEQRLEESGLSLVAGQPVHSISIMADGRRLWRVMDNLMNNICKYAMPGTRVFLSLEDINGEAVISFKNTSRDPLELSPEELTERFVRGDASRGSEGSGLGLSIARSLTELQGGRLELVCDGDLFKAVLRFPIIK